MRKFLYPKSYIDRRTFNMINHLNEGFMIIGRLHISGLLKHDKFFLSKLQKNDIIFQTFWSKEYSQNKLIRLGKRYIGRKISNTSIRRVKGICTYIPNNAQKAPLIEGAFPYEFYDIVNYVDKFIKNYDEVLKKLGIHSFHKELYKVTNVSSIYNIDKFHEMDIRILVPLEYNLLRLAQFSNEKKEKQRIKIIRDFSRK